MTLIWILFLIIILCIILAPITGAKDVALDAFLEPFKNPESVYYKMSHKIVTVKSKKDLTDLQSTPFNGVYLIKMDPTANEPMDLPVWQWTMNGPMYCWVGGGRFLPFARFHVSHDKIAKLFQDMMKLKVEFKNMPFSLERLPHRLTIANHYVSFQYTDQLSPCVDYFQEEARMVCTRRDKPSHWTLYNEMYDQLSKQYKLNAGPNEDNYLKVHDALWKRSYSCTEINPDVTVGILQWAQENGHEVERMLDMSAGRGSRMIAAIAVEANRLYHGVDPNPLSGPWYETQAMYFVNQYNKDREYFHMTKAPQNYKVIKSGFLEANLMEEFYDIMFSSPPYFDLEVYSTDGNQSTVKYGTLDRWINEFMIPCMDKIMRSLHQGGLMCININISQRYADDWVSPLIEYDKGCTYIGCIGSYKIGKDTVQPTWIWRKHGLEASRIQPNLGWVMDENTSYLIKFHQAKAASISQASKQVRPRTISLITVLYRSPKELVGQHVWSITDTHAVLAKNATGHFIPLQCLNQPLAAPKYNTVEWTTLNRPWSVIPIVDQDGSNKMDQSNKMDPAVYKFEGKDLIIKIIADDCIYDGTFLDQMIMRCRRAGFESPWNIFLSKLAPLKFYKKDALKHETTYADFQDWCYFNRIFCIASRFSQFIAIIEFLRQQGHPCQRILVMENNVFNNALFAAINVGCEELTIVNLAKERSEWSRSIMHWYDPEGRVGRWCIEDEFNGENKLKGLGASDFALFSPTYYNVQQPSDDHNESFNKYHLQDQWIKEYIIGSIVRTSDRMARGGIICMIIGITTLKQAGLDIINQLNQICIQAPALRFMGGFSIFKNTLLQVWCWQKMNP